MSGVPAEPRFTVRRLNWKSPAEGWYVRLPGWTEIAAFDSPEAAESARRRREAEVRAAVNPFDCAGSFFELSTLPGPILLDWLMDGGLEPPPPTAPLADWRRWWAEAAPEMTADQRAHAWAGFDKLRFYETAERPGPAVVHVVLGVYWDLEYDRYVYEAGFEGGNPVRAFRSTRAAEAERLRVAADVQSEIRDNEYYAPALIEVGPRAERSRDPFADPRPREKRMTADDAPFAETAAVAVAADPGAVRVAGSVYIVQRLSWRWIVSKEDIIWVPLLPEEGRADGVPVAAFLTRKEAESLAWELDYVPRLYLNPFRFGHPEDLTSVAETGFRAVLGDTGLQLPADDWYMRLRWSVYPGDETRGVPAVPHPWPGWWNATADGMSAAQRDAVWDLLDQLRFHQVRELELRD
jgi:hypothetical protein